MTIDTFAKMNCSIGRTMSFLGERWTPLVLRELFFRNTRFESIQAELGIASNVLSDRLNSLVEEGVVVRHRYSEHPERFEYRLTEKGFDLQAILLAVQAWGDAHTAGPKGPPLDLVHTDCGHVAHARAVCDHCGGEMHAHNVQAQAGPGANKAQRERSARVQARRRTGIPSRK